MAPPTPKTTVYTRTLTLAAETLGGAQPLAKHLKADPAALLRWIAGEEFPPHEALLQALDIVAGGPRVDPDSRPRARRARDHADRLQASANRVRESAQRMQSSAEPAASSGQFRQVQPKDGAPASNKADKRGEDEEKQAKG